MKVTHRLQVACTCPSDELGDVYDVVVEADRLILVEEILKLAEEAEHKKVYQEDLCVEWARKLRARVTMTGSHFGLVTTTVQA